MVNLKFYITFPQKQTRETSNKTGFLAGSQIEGQL